MMAPDKVIVTIRSADGQCCGDYELPANIPVKKYKDLLLEALIQHASRSFANCRDLGAGLYLEEKGRFVRIPDEDTLAAHGVWDGSFVNVLRLNH